MLRGFRLPVPGGKSAAIEIINQAALVMAIKQEGIQMNNVVSMDFILKR